MPQSQSSFLRQLRPPICFTCVGGNVFSLSQKSIAPIPLPLQVSKPNSFGRAANSCTWYPGNSHKVSSRQRKFGGQASCFSNARIRNRLRCRASNRKKPLCGFLLDFPKLLALCQSKPLQHMRYRHLNRPLSPAQMHNARLGTGQLALLPAAQCFSTSLTTPSSGQPRSTGSAAHVRR
jgi:hypothetical protein